MAGSDLQAWALPRLARLLPLDNASLSDILAYAASLPAPAAASHLQNLLGDSGPALEFVAAFNARRGPAETVTARHGQSDGGQGRARPRRGQANIHALPARRVVDRGGGQGAYVKRAEDEYMPAAGKPKASAASAAPAVPAGSNAPTARPSPPASGAASRTASPAPPPPRAKASIAGGRPMLGAATSLSDLDAAIRALEQTTNPTLTSSDPGRRCGCMATRHALLATAPNCLACGNIVCVKQGLGPCAACGAPLLSGVETQEVLRVLREERGRERQAVGNAGPRRADVARGKAVAGREFLAANTGTADGGAGIGRGPDAGLGAATEHRDRLLAFQASNARRTRVHDEAADFAVPDVGADGAVRAAGAQWKSAGERAAELRRQMGVLRKAEFEGKEEWERRRVVASIDLSGKRVRREVVVEKWGDREGQVEVEEAEEVVQKTEGTGKKTGAFGRNPLLGKMIRPMLPSGGAKAADKSERRERENKSQWRRVQDDLDDNEGVILDGGTRGFDISVEA